MANRQTEHLDNGTSLGDSGYDVPRDIVNPVPGMDLDAPIPNPGKMTSYESPSYECAFPKATSKAVPQPRESMLWSRHETPWIAIGALALVLIVATRSSA